MARLLLTTSLLLGTALMVTACSSQSTDTDTKLDTAQAEIMTSKFDPAAHTYLEEVEGEAALSEVKAWNAASADSMQDNVYSAMKTELLEVYNSPEKIPYISFRKGYAYNFWQDDKNVRGIWRRTTLESYSSDNPDWDTILDFDALAKIEDKNWVFKGSNCVGPDYTRCMVSLSDGGKDAVVQREFDIPSKSFVKDGFVTHESKGSTWWLDKDTVLVGIDFGEGTMTESGYPTQVKLWKRGSPLSDATLLSEGPKDDVGHWGFSFKLADGTEEVLIQRTPSFFTREYFWLPKTDDGFAAPVKFPVPLKSNLAGEYKGQSLLTLQEDWRGFKAGALLSFDLLDFMEDGNIDQIAEVFTPTTKQSLEDFGITKSGLLLSINEDVAAKAFSLDFVDGAWIKTELDFPGNGAISVNGTDRDEDIAFMTYESFLSPDSYFAVDMSTVEMTKLKGLPDWFDSDSMEAKQHFVTSSDGTRVPYFIIHRKDLKMDGNNPTILYGYGGFRISLNPSYSATIGRAWLERGGVYVVANTRGGEEYGPQWHQAGLKENRQLIYDDFISVAEDLIDKGVTTPKHLGTHGRSNGGLLMGVMFTQRPDLFNAVAIGVPLLDMHRYHTLLAGASWVGEYGNPEDKGAEGEFIRALSPYHNLKEDVDYPVPYIYTSTKDDRVHPAHARKFAKRLEEMGKDFVYYENINGGHAGAANLEETAHSQALIYSYFWNALN